jgi:hypothetical protein
MKIECFSLWLLAIGALLNANTASAQQTSAFTYQGQLRDGGTNANGTYTMIFKLYDSPGGNNQIGIDATNNPALVNGFFSVNLDFGAGAFNGNARWLEINVAGDTLTPRVQILPSPYAMFAATAASVPAGAISSAQLATSAVTTAKIQDSAITNSKLTANVVATTNIQDAAVTNPKLATDSVAAANIQGNAVTAAKIASGQAVKSLNGLTDHVSLSAGANMVVFPTGNGLEISGGASLVTADESNLRVVRGVISSAGTIASGHGFSMQYNPVGSGGAFSGNFQRPWFSLSRNLLVDYGSAPLVAPQAGGYIMIAGAFYKIVSYVTNSDDINPNPDVDTPVTGYDLVFDPPAPSLPDSPIAIYVNSKIYPTFNITFDTAFSAPPAVVATAHGENYVIARRDSPAAYTTGFQAQIIRQNIYNIPIPDGFDFIAIGPR